MPKCVSHAGLPRKCLLCEAWVDLYKVHSLHLYDSLDLESLFVLQALHHKIDLWTAAGELSDMVIAVGWGNSWRPLCPTCQGEIVSLVNDIYSTIGDPNV